MTIKKIRQIDLDVLERLILVLYESTEENKTNIARNSEMSYDKCVLYLDVLEMMGTPCDSGTGIITSYDIAYVNSFYP